MISSPRKLLLRGGLLAIMLFTVWCCNPSKELVQIKNESECSSQGGYWYGGKCWPAFEESLITKANVDSVVEAQIEEISKAYVKINDDSFSIDFFFPEQDGEEMILIVSFKSLEENLLIPFNPESIGEENFKAEAVYLRGNILEGEEGLEPVGIAEGQVNVSITEDFDVEIKGLLQNDSEQFKVEVKANEAVLGAGTSNLKVKGKEAFLSGTLGTITYNQLKNVIKNHPEVETIVLQDVRGSINDEVNMHTGRILREAGLNTKVLADSHIASGGVDLFAAGVSRTVVKGAKLGVHSWAGEDVKGDELPKEHPAHQYQLRYFRQMLGEKFGPDFYFYTLTSAPAEDIYYMSDKEIQEWTLSTVFKEK